MSDLGMRWLCRILHRWSGWGLGDVVTGWGYEKFAYRYCHRCGLMQMAKEWRAK